MENNTRLTANEMYLKFIEDNGSGPDPDDIVDLMELYHATRPLRQAEPHPLPLEEIKQPAPGAGWVKADTPPKKSRNYITHVRIEDDGCVFEPVAYNRYDAEKKEWVRPSACGEPGEIIDWLDDESQPAARYTAEDVLNFCKMQRGLCLESARLSSEWKDYKEWPIIDEQSILTAPAPILPDNSKTK